MLIRFVVSNFLSFNEEREFDMLPSSLKTHKHHVYNVGKLKVLKSAAIYGANGAGKSNLIKSIEFVQDLVNSSALSKSINDKKFKLNSANNSKPVTFEIEFSIGKKIYSYGLNINGNFIEEEWLYESGITTSDKLIFERKRLKSGKTKIQMAPKHSKTQKQKVLIELMEDNLLKPNEVFLSKTQELKIKEISLIEEYIVKKIVIIHPGSRFQTLVPALTTSKRFNSFANDLLHTFDTGVSQLGIENTDFQKFFGDEDEELKNELITEIEDGNSVLVNTESGGVLATKEDGVLIVKRVVAEHLDNNGQKIDFDLSEESDGTQRLLDFIPAFDGMLEGEVTFIIDEIDQSLHPTLLKSLVKKIMADENTVGQLIFTTHESNLLDLDIFRQDEIWFAEKDSKLGSSQLYSLSEFKPRYDLDIRKGYLKGRFGAIPFLANLNDLNWHTDNA